jgi:hypothetical protein
MQNTLKLKKMDFFSNLQLMADESKSDDEFVQLILRWANCKEGGLRAHVQRECNALSNHIDGLMLDRRAIARLVE